MSAGASGSRVSRLRIGVLIGANLAAFASAVDQATPAAASAAPVPAAHPVLANTSSHAATPAASGLIPLQTSTTPLDARFLPAKGTAGAPAPSAALPAPQSGAVTVPTQVTGSAIAPAAQGYVAGQSVLDPTLSGATFNVYDNPDHTLTAQLHSSPVNWQDRQGRWQPIDSRIRALADGSLHTTSGPTDVQFGRSATDATLFQVQNSIYSVGFRPLHGAKASPAVIANNSVSYANVLPNVDLKFVAGSTATDALLVLRAPPAGTGDVSFTVPLSVNGLTATTTSAGTIAFTDATGRVAFAMPQGWMEDSNVDPRWGSGAISPVAVQLATGGTALTVTASGAWLHDPSRQYPVTIDPATFNDYSNGDTYISDAFQNSNFNVSYDSTLGAYVDNIGYWNPGGNNRTYLGYDMSPLFGHFIISATWKGMFAWSSSLSPTAFTMHPVTAGWSPSTMTWSSRANYNSSISATGSGVRNAWSSVDLTSWVVNWANQSWANDGLEIEAAWNDSTYWKRLRSDEDGATGNGATPVVSVTYEWFGNPNYRFGTQASDSGYGANPPAFRGPAPNATTTLPVTITNNGTDAWPANGSYKLTYHLLNADGTLNTYSNARTLMPSTVNPGQTLTLNANVGPISAGGSYILQWDMVQEGIAWFSNYGSPTANFNIFVEPPPTPQSPANGTYYYSTPITLTTSSVPNATQYRFEVSADPNFGSGVIASAWQAGASYTISSGLADGTTYSWRAFAANAGKNTTGPSSVATFVYNSRVPVATKTADRAGQNGQPPIYAAGEPITYTVSLQNISSVSETNVGITDTLPAGLNVIGTSVSYGVQGSQLSTATCSGASAPCLISSGSVKLLSGAKFTIPVGATGVVTYEAVASGLERGCATLANTAFASDSFGSAPPVGTAVTVCDSGLGFENWWTYERQGIGPQAQAAVNVANGNLVVQQTDGTSVTVHGHLALELRRTYNSEDTAILAAPGSIGSGWTLNVSEAGGLGDAGVGADGLIVPSPSNLLQPLAVTLVDQDGTRHTFQPRVLTSIVNVPTVSGALATLVPQLLSAASGDVLCVDQSYTAPAGVHLALWRYLQIPGSTCPTSPGTLPSNTSVVGYAAERPDRLRYEFSWDGHLIGIEDPEGNQLVYQYDSAPLPEVALGNLDRIYEPATGRGFRFDYSVANEIDITDPAGRFIQYKYASEVPPLQHLTSVITSVPATNGWQQVSSWQYAYGNCTGATANQLCSVIDPRGSATTFSYTTKYADGTTQILGPPRLSTIRDRNGVTTTYTYSTNPDATFSYDGAEQNVYETIDAKGRVGDVSQGVNGSNTRRWTTYTWDTTSASCQYVDNNTVDNDLCGVWQHAGSAPSDSVQPPPSPTPAAPQDEDTTYQYTPEGQVVHVHRQPSPSVSTPSTDVTTGYHTQYVQPTGTTVYCFDDQLSAGGIVTSAPSSGLGCNTPPTRPTAEQSSVFALTDKVTSLTANGNAADASSYQQFQTTYYPDDNASARPNSATLATGQAALCSVPNHPDQNTGSQPTQNTGSLCEVSAPLSTVTTYTYDTYGQKVTMRTPVANGVSPAGAPYTYDYYPNANQPLAGPPSASAGGWLKDVKDPTGNFVVFAYDAAGNVVRTWDRNATTTNTANHTFTSPDQYPGTGSPLSPVPPGYAQRVYDAASGAQFASPWRYLTSSTDPLTNTTSYTVDANGNQTAIRPPRGNAAGNATYDITQAFNRNDNMTCRLEPLEANGVTCSQYVTNPGAYTSTHPTSYTYDQFGNKTSQMDPDGNVTAYIYDTVNRLTTTRWTRGAYVTGVSAPGNCTGPTQSSDAPLPSGRIVCFTSTAYDGLNHPLITMDANGFETHTTFDYLGRPTLVEGPRVVNGANTQTSTVYDADGNAIEVCNPRQFSEYGGACAAGTQGATVTKQYDALDRLTTSITYRETTGGAAAAVPGQTTNFVSLSTQYAYDGDGNQTSLTAPNSGVTTTGYNALDRKTSQSVPRTSNTDTNTTNWTYDANGNTLSVKAPGNRITAYQFDADNRVTDTVTGASSADAASDGPTDASGGSNIRTRVVYDPDGHVVRTFTPGAFAASVTSPDASYMQVTTYDADGNATAQYVPRYDNSAHSDMAGAGSTQSSECPQAQGYPTGVGVCVTSAQYDAAGRRTAILPPRHVVDAADVIIYAYTDDGLRSSVTQPNPASSGTATTSFAYDGVGRQTSATTPASHNQTWTTTSTTYTADGLVAGTSAPGPDLTASATATSSYAYDAAGNQTSAQVNDRPSMTSLATTKTRYYADNSRWTVTRADQEAVPSGYGTGAWTSFVGTTRNTTAYMYDAGGNPSAVYSPAAWAVVVAAPSAFQDSANSGGAPTTNHYTLDNLIEWTIAPVATDGSQQRRTDTGYDAAGRMTSQHVYLVDATGTNPISGKDGGSLGYGYYPDDRLQKQAGRDSSTVTRSYNPAGAATCWWTSSDTTCPTAPGAPKFTATYYLDGSPRTADDASATTALSYDGSGALAWEQEFSDTSGSFATSTITTTYGSAEQAQSALWTTSTGLSKTTQWTYNADGSLYTIALPNGATDTYSPNNNDTPSEAKLTASSGTLADWTYTYNGASQILTQGFSGAAGASLGGNFVSGASATFSMTYDPAMRLQSFQQGSNPAQAFGWDHNGDRISWQTLSGNGGTSGTVSTTTAAYNADASICATETGTAPLHCNQASGSVNFTYAPFGGTASDGCISYSYDGFDREAQTAPTQGANCTTSTVNYTYDPLGRQATHSDTTTTTHFFGLSSTVAAEITPTASTLYEPTAHGVEGLTQGSTTQFLSDDGHGTLTTATDSSGGIACTARFDPYGTALGAPPAPSGQSVPANACDSGSTLGDLFYRGAIRNQTTGDYQFGQRTYDPTKGTFLTPDMSPTLNPKQNPTVGTDPLTANTYAYVNGDPVNLIDPNGHRYTTGDDHQDANSGVYCRVCYTYPTHYERGTSLVAMRFDRAVATYVDSLTQRYIDWGEGRATFYGMHAYNEWLHQYDTDPYDAGAYASCHWESGTDLCPDSQGAYTLSGEEFAMAHLPPMSWADLGIGVASLIVAGGCTAFSATIAIAACVGITGAASSAAHQYVDSGHVDFGQVALSGGIGAGTVGLFGAASSLLPRVVAAGAADTAASDGSFVVGRSGSPINIEPGTNVPTEINGTQFTGHALDQMQGRGIPPSVVQNTINVGTTSAGYDGATIYYDSVNGVKVILNPDGSVKTVIG